MVTHGLVLLTLTSTMRGWCSMRKLCLVLYLCGGAFLLYALYSLSQVGM